MERNVLRASDGMIITNGKVYGKTIYLSTDADASKFYEITKEEYEKILESRDVDENLHR